MPRIRCDVDPYSDVSQNYTSHELARLLLTMPNKIVGVSTKPGHMQYAISVTTRHDGEVLITSPDVVHGKTPLPHTAQEIIEEAMKPL